MRLPDEQVHNMLEAWEEACAKEHRSVFTNPAAGRALATELLESREELMVMKKALTAIRYINHGPDKASAEWRCMEAAQIARNALEEIALQKCDAPSDRSNTQNNS
jgi:hypothetical protein